MEARELLAPIYGWFAEGFDTPDRFEAKVLIDALPTENCESIRRRGCIDILSPS
jgi:hypothetical protein